MTFKEALFCIVPLVVERRAVSPESGEKWRENGRVKLALEGAVVGLGRGGGRKSFRKGTVPSESEEERPGFESKSCQKNVGPDKKIRRINYNFQLHADLRFPARPGTLVASHSGI